MAALERAVVADPGVRCLAVSQMVAEEFQQFYQRSANVRVIYNGVDVPPADSSKRAISSTTTATCLPFWAA